MSRAVVFKQVSCFLEQAPWVLNSKLILVKMGLGRGGTYSWEAIYSIIERNNNEDFSKTARALKEEFQKGIYLNIR